LRLFKLNPTSRPYALECVQSAPDGYVVRVNEPTRSLEQNSLLWALLSDVSDKIVWHGQKLSTEDWKNVFTAALKKARVVPGIDGGFVVCGQSTSKMSKGDFSELVELIYAFGADHDVQWSQPAQIEWSDYRRVA
jgi:hypothetical protein